MVQGTIQQFFKKAIRFIKSCVQSGKNILIHCHAGKSRSVCIVVRYLIETEGIGRDEALMRVSEKREIYLSDGIEEIFHTMEI